MKLYEDLFVRLNNSKYKSKSLKPSVFVWLCFIGYLIFRIKFSLDFTDEMQYYGELSSLILSGSFFKSDLFFQQLGYIFLYPIMRLFAIADPNLSYLVIFTRILFAAYILFITYLSYRKLKLFGISGILATFLSISLGMVVISDGIFAFSYNTFFNSSFIFFSLYFLFYERFDSNAHKNVVAMIIVFSLITYPTAGIAYLLISVIHLSWLNIRLLLFKLFTYGSLFLGFILFFKFTSLGCLKESFFFTSQFNQGSRQFFDDPPFVLIGVLLLFIFTRLTIMKAHYVAMRKREVFLYFYLLLMILLLIKGFVDDSMYHTFFLAGSVFYLFLLVAHFSFDSNNWSVIRDKLFRGLDLWTLLALVISISSSNGVFKLFNLSLLIYPFIAAILFFNYNKLEKLSILKTIFVLKIVLFSGFALYGSTRSYRDNLDFSYFSQTDCIPEFKGVSISRNKSKILHNVCNLNLKYLEDQDATVIGPHPWLYFALGLRANSKMFFNHFRGSETVKIFLLSEIERTKPRYVVLTDISELSLKDQLRVRKYLQEKYSLKNRIFFNDSIRYEYYKETSYRLPKNIEVYSESGK